MISVSSPYLPSRIALEKYIDTIYKNKQLTNNGPLVEQLTSRLEQHLGVKNLLLVSNGTLALQVAYKALGISSTPTSPLRGDGEVITTPFSFAATASSIMWEGLTPRFADIDPETWCIDPKKIRKISSKKTKAIVPVHVFGHPCEVEKIDEIAHSTGARVVYDGAHAFGVNYKGSSLLSWGDASIISFHATKLFHTIEGGAIVFRKRKDLDLARKLINFGFSKKKTISAVGINAKMNEFQAAMGMAVLDEINNINEARSQAARLYDEKLQGKAVLQKTTAASSRNNSYYPILLKKPNDTPRLQKSLRSHGIETRRYFYPTLNREPFSAGKDKTPIADNISRRILCLPMHHLINANDVDRVCRIVLDNQA